ncbi:MAG: autotransporter-associated beta strand repeat-containing protein, partial [Verrucomicrobiota bacterium]
METNLKALLSFEGNLADGSSVGTHTGTWVGSSSYASSVPSAVGAGGSVGYFDGATRVTLAGGDLNMNSANAFTVSAWIKTGFTDTGNHVILAKSGGSGGATPALYVNSSGKLVYDVYGINAVTSNSSVRTGNWVHIALTGVSGSNVYSLYINGVLEQTKTFSGGPGEPSVATGNGTWPFTIGQSSSSFPGGSFLGNIDEVRFWQRTLSDAEILTMATAGVSSLGVNKTTAGTVILSGANTYRGDTNVTGGTLQLGNGGTSGSLSTVSALSVSSGAVLAFNRSDTVTQGTDFGSVISGAGAVLQAGSGMLILSGSNTYTGNTTVSSGVLNIQNAAALGSTAGSTKVSSGAALQIQGGIAVGAEALTLNGSGVSSDGALRNISDTNSYSGAITLGSASRINSDSGLLTLSGAVTGAYALSIGGEGNLAFSGVIATSSGSLTKDGGGTATLSASNTYSGSTTVNGGNLKLTDNAVLALKNSVVVNSGASFEVSLSNASTVASSYTISGAGTVVKSGSGKWTVGANGLHVNFNLSSGGLIDIQAGTIQANYNGTSFGSNQGSVNIASGSILDFYAENGQMDALNGAGILQNGYAGGSHNVTLGVAGSSGVFSGVIKDGNSTALVLTKSGSGTQVLSGTNTYTGTTTISAGSLVLGAGGTTGSLSTSSALVDNAMIGFNRSNTITQGSEFASMISGSGALVQLGSGTLVLNAINSYTGGTTVSAGSLMLVGGNNRLSTSGSIFAAGGVLDLGGYSQSTSGAISISGGIVQNGALTASSGPFELQSGTVSAVLAGTQGLLKT